MKSFIFSNPIYLEAQEKKTTATKMKTQHLALKLMCVFTVFPLTHQYFRSFGLRKSMRTLQSLILDELNFLQQKLANGIFKKEDMQVLNSLEKLILNQKELLERERKRQHTVYWLTRQGR